MTLPRGPPRRALDARGALQAAQPLLEEAAALETRDQSPPGVGFLRGKGAGVYAGVRDRMTHRRFSGDHHIVGDAEMTGESDHAADHATPADTGTAGDAGARGDRCVRSDAYVVGNHDQIVELKPRFDHRGL